jgi:hypothetical protein
MFIHPMDLAGFSLQRSENAWFDVFIYQYIALRWSAKQ